MDVYINISIIDIDMDCSREIGVGEVHGQAGMVVGHPLGDVLDLVGTAAERREEGVLDADGHYEHYDHHYDSHVLRDRHGYYHQNDGDIRRSVAQRYTTYTGAQQNMSSDIPRSQAAVEAQQLFLDPEKYNMHQDLEAEEHNKRQSQLEVPWPCLGLGEEHNKHQDPEVPAHILPQLEEQTLEVGQVHRRLRQHQPLPYHHHRRQT